MLTADKPSPAIDSSELTAKMSQENLTDARFVANIVLSEVNLNRSRLSEVLNYHLSKTAERQRTTDLVFGTIRNRNGIDMLITKLADCPLSRIPQKIQNIIRVGVYEIVYCPQTPTYAIVNQAVEVCRAYAGRRDMSFVNAVLRQITRSIKNRQLPLPDKLSKDSMPQSIEFGCQFGTAVLPDFETSPAEYLSLAFSLPMWLLENWIGDFGPEQAKEICFASNRRPGTYLRTNCLKTTPEKLSKKLKQAKFECQIIDDLMIKAESPAETAKIPGFSEGLFSIQDLTASKAVKLLDPKANQTILDLCAAPGTKTCQIAEATGDKAKIIATDLDNQRLEKIEDNINRLKLTSIDVIKYGKLQDKIREVGAFDCILMDVPCSNTGVLSKRPEVRYRINAAAIKGLAQTQYQLLQDAAGATKSNGKICYSTCSVQKEENSDLIKMFLSKNKDFSLQAEELTLPCARFPDHDGGYAAILAKK